MVLVLIGIFGDEKVSLLFRCWEFGDKTVSLWKVVILFEDVNLVFRICAFALGYNFNCKGARLVFYTLILHIRWND